MILGTGMYLVNVGEISFPSGTMIPASWLSISGDFPAVDDPQWRYMLHMERCDAKCESPSRTLQRVQPFRCDSTLRQSALRHLMTLYLVKNIQNIPEQILNIPELSVQVDISGSLQLFGWAILWQLWLPEAIGGLCVFCAGVAPEVERSFVHII